MYRKYQFINVNETVDPLVMCDYLIRMIRVYEIDIELIKLQREHGGVYLLDNTTIQAVTAWEYHFVNEMFKDKELKIIDSSNKYQVEIAEFRRFLHNVLRPDNSKYWKRLAPKNNNKMRLGADLALIFNQLIKVMSQYEEELNYLLETNEELDIELLDVQKIIPCTDWSPKLSRKTLHDPALEPYVTNTSNKLQVEKSVFKKYLCNGIRVSQKGYWSDGSNPAA